MIDIVNAVKAIERARGKTLNGAHVIGAHIEEPYFSIGQKGAHNPKFIRSPKREKYLRLLDQCGESILGFSAAPELQGGLKLGQDLKKYGIVASIAHSEAAYQDIVAAVRAGHSHVTHIYSGMSGLKRINAYRISDIIEATLLLDELTTEVIADGHHLPPSLMKLVVKTKSVDGVSLVTDATRATGLGPGEYSIGGMDVVVEANVPKEFELPEQERNYVAKLFARDSFAGSVATMNCCVRNMVELVGVSMETAIQMATINPAKVVGIDNKKGSLAQGRGADLVILGENCDVIMTVVRGRIVYT